MNSAAVRNVAAPCVRSIGTMTLFRTAAATAGLLAAIALPLAAPAASIVPAQPHTYHLQTRLFDRYGVGEYDGALTMTVSPDGIVGGTYRDLDAGAIRTVTGGLQPDGHIWLDIGGAHPLRLSGTFQNGALTTVAAIPGPAQYLFESTNVPKG